MRHVAKTIESENLGGNKRFENAEPKNKLGVEKFWRENSVI